MEELLTAEDRIIDNPVKFYDELHKRLLEKGANAPFPEFKPVVDFLLQEIESKDFDSVLNAHPDLKYEMQEVRTILAHVNIAFTFDDESVYPYAVPFEAPFPYRPTIDAIETALRFLDKLNRLEPGNKAVPLYHFDRYAYHRHSLVADPEIVLLPTIRNLTFFDLIRTRSVPIGFIGVFSKTTRVDRHQQSPLDFWYHDLNHVRRMSGYLRLREKQQNLNTEKEKLDYYQRMDDFIVTKIVPNIVKLPKGSDREEVAIRRLVRMIIFEILHESALTAERDVIVTDLLRSSGPQPFEHMVEEKVNLDKSEIEKLRTPTGNIKSGFSVIKPGNNETITVRFFFDRALALLANVYNKINFGFYDDPESPSEFVVPLGYRKPEHIVAAAKKIFEILEVNEYPSDEELLRLVVTREGAQEKFVYKAINMDDTEFKQSATEPISAEEIIQQIKAMNKQVYTLFGYSKLDYQNKEEVMAEIKSELGKLDLTDTVINIGATEDGIGYAYKIAKEMGFDTIGIVSTQSLTYSGKFSEYVDKIFIVNDHNWGGYVPGTKNLAETTKAYLAVSNVISAHGGGENTAVILNEAKKLGIKTKYSPAEMNHDKAIEQARIKKENPPVDYKGAAFYAWQKIESSS